MSFYKHYDIHAKHWLHQCFQSIAIIRRIGHCKILIIIEGANELGSISWAQKAIIICQLLVEVDDIVGHPCNVNESHAGIVGVNFFNWINLTKCNNFSEYFKKSTYSVIARSLRPINDNAINAHIFVILHKVHQVGRIILCAVNRRHAQCDRWRFDWFQWSPGAMHRHADCFHWVVHGECDIYVWCISKWSVQKVLEIRFFLNYNLRISYYFQSFLDVIFRWHIAFRCTKLPSFHSNVEQSSVYPFSRLCCALQSISLVKLKVIAKLVHFCRRKRSWNVSLIQKKIMLIPALVPRHLPAPIQIKKALGWSRQIQEPKCGQCCLTMWQFQSNFLSFW